MSLSKILSIAVLSGAAVLTPVVANALDAPVAGHSAVASHPVTAAQPATAVPHPVAKPQPKPLPVIFVRPGQRLDIGHGAWMTLSHTERCLNDGTTTTCTNIMDGNQPPGTVSVRTWGDRARTLYSPLYIGPGKAARMTVEAGGRTYQAHVVTLADYPGYATGYVWAAPMPQKATGGPSSRLEVTVYDASGRVLARL